MTRFAWATLVFNVIVILMGAVVRATGSGAGCGRSWPTCRGEVVPALQGATAVEFAHRAVSGVALVMVAVLVWWVLRSVPRGHPARGGAVVSLVAIIGEALIGAVIVLFEWVAADASVARAVSVPLHLVNTFLLLAALTLTIHWLSGGGRLRPSDHPRTWRWVVAGGIGVLLIAASGAVTALADTLFPKDGSGADAVEHFLTDLRVIHPIVAVTVVVAAWVAVGRRGLDSRPVRVMAVLVGVQLLTGVVMISLGVPLWLSLVHLLLADGLWVAYVFLAADLLAAEPGVSPSVAPGAPRAG